MRIIAFVFFTVLCNSCFLFSDFKKSRFAYSRNGVHHSLDLVVPKGFIKTKKQTDSTGNQIQYYYYPGSTVLYFALLKDTSTQLQPINYNLNIPKELYNTVFFKGIDSSEQYWRETRFDHYKAGYKNVEEGEDGVFDSSINYFSLHVKR